VGHLEVRDHEVVLVFDEDVHGLAPVADALDLVTVTSQQFREVVPAQLVVLGDEDPDVLHFLLDLAVCHGRLFYRSSGVGVVG